MSMCRVRSAMENGYNRETLEVKYKGKSIYDVLNMTVEEALGILQAGTVDFPKVTDPVRCRPFLHPPRPAVHHAVRRRSATYQARSRAEPPRHGKTIYILDEPTTGLHFADVHKLVEILHRLSEGGNTVVVIEHNLDVIKTADYIIDIGPEGGDGGGTVIACGTPEEVAKSPVSYTGKYVEKYL